MADFYQHLKVPTLHHLADHEPTVAAVQEWKGDREVAVLLPALFSECGRPAFGEILRAIATIGWVDRVVVSMNGATAEQAVEARAFMRACVGGMRADLVWNEDPEMRPLWEQVEADQGSPVHGGKGANVWAALAWLAAHGHRGWVLAHDSDICGYQTQLLTRLAMPVVHPEMGYRFAKGYYSRVSDRLYGRVTRLLVFPLLQAIQDVLGPKPMIEHLQGFRYPLAGEFGAEMELLAQMPLDPGWGLEIGLLAELQRQVPVERFCQVDLGFHYEHRHRGVDANPAHEAEEGLRESAGEVAGAIFAQILRDADDRAAEALSRVIVPRYEERAEEWRSRYERVGLINGLVVDPESEQRCLRLLTEVLKRQVGNRGASGSRPTEALPPVGEWLKAHPELRQVLASLKTRVE